MSRPFVLVQLSDPHIGAAWGDADPVSMYTAAVDAVRSLRLRPDALLVSGDLADTASDVEYQALRELTEPLDVPVYVVAGNHDDRQALHRHFGVPGANGEPVQYSVDLGPARLLVLDSKREGADSGELDADRLAWLDAQLAAAPDAPTILAVHHPPLPTGIPAMDDIGLPASDRHALAQVIERHAQVRRVVAGHVHRTVTGEVGGRPVLAVPSTYLQVQLDLGSAEPLFTSEQPGFGVHIVLDGEVVSHIQPVSQPKEQ
jgi:3',5'-cyclic-AMP phosphodiesterase